MSLLDKKKEVAMRPRLPKDARMHTGDDFSPAELIGDDDRGYSDAVLGTFACAAHAGS